MKCWTVQQKEFLEGAGDVITARSDHVSPHWQDAYAWLARQYCRIMNGEKEFTPIWLWKTNLHDDSDANRYRLAWTVFCDIESTVDCRIVDVDVPQEVALALSYNRWNTLMDYSLIFGCTPTCDKDWSGIFDCEGLAEHDDVQVVVPHIRREWIKDVVPVNAGLLRKYGEQRWTQ